MKRLVPFAVALLGLAALAPLAADEPTLSPDELKSSVLKDCKTYQIFCAAKHARIKEALRRGGESEATHVTERLLSEEARTLKRVIWYLGIDRAQKATRETLEKVLAKVESTPPPDALKATVAGKFAAPAWLADPFNYKDGEGGAKPEEKPEPTISTSSGSKAPSSTNYGVSGTSAAPDIKPVSAPVTAPPPAEAPPPPPPPPAGGGENPGGGGSGAGSGGGSHSSH